MAGSDDRSGRQLFWADQIADEILERKKFRYIDRQIKRPAVFVVKTSASISGVLHIGRLSDTIRGESVVRALMDRGAKAEFIWVAEDMDPLRGIPKGVPANFSEYIGMPVTDVPDPDGCHKTYAEHHTAKYFEVLDEFVSVKMKRLSTRDEYRKGSFGPFIRKILQNVGEVVSIQNRYRQEPLPAGWSPWKPICGNCGKIITTSVKRFEGGKAVYRCEDYSFEKVTAKGCGHEGENDPLAGKGKLVWKGEWASEWALWGVCSEGAGKEYQVPNSAWWVNAEIAERVLGYPMPVPIFYEHLMIDGEKMSASKGNVVYPEDWLRFATPELLRFFYNKRIMKTRSFSWGDLPNLYDDYDRHESVYLGKSKADNEKEGEHMRRLYEMSQMKPGKPPQAGLPFDFAVSIAQAVPGESIVEMAIDILRKTGHVTGSVSAAQKAALKERLLLAKEWAAHHAPERYRFELRKGPAGHVDPGARKVMARLAAILEKKETGPDDLLDLFYSLCKEEGVDTKAFFRAMYNVLIGKDYGPRLAPFVITIGRKKVAGILKSV